MSTVISITFYLSNYTSYTYVDIYVYSVHLGVGEGIYCTFICYAYAPWFLYFSFGLDLGFMNVLYWSWFYRPGYECGRCMNALI